MTNEERTKAFEMRLAGCSWEEIGKAIGYTRQTVQQDLKLCIMGNPRQVNCVYPAIRKVITEKYGGSVTAFSKECGVPVGTLYYVLSGRGDPKGETTMSILRTSGLTYEEAFGEVDA